MKSRILITGGAGFIGSFLTDRLIEKGHQVRIIDNLDPQVHIGRKPPKYLNKNAEFIEGDVLDSNILHKALKSIDVVFHLASSVGVGQSQYEIFRYSNVNCSGTANLWNVIIKNKIVLDKVILPSSMTCFGEGMSLCTTCGIVKPAIRSEEEVSEVDFDCRCPKCEKSVSPIPTTSDCIMEPSSVYALSKKYQEDLSLIMGKTYGIKTCVFRCFNVYGPRQSLSNPYTGVTAIFLSRIKNSKSPVIYEDGLQTRDFISVHDVVDAKIMAMETDKMDGKVQNLGSGVPTSIKSVAETLISMLNKRDILAIDITKRYRKGDIRHCYIDINELKDNLNFTPKVSFEDGMRELVNWSYDENAIDQFDIATNEMANNGLL